MIKFLDLEKFIKNLMPVTTTEYFTRAGEFHIDGLFSEKIFGVSDRERISTFSYIELCAKVIHPEALKILIQLDQKVEKFISTEEKFQLDSDSCLQVSDGGVTGIEEFIKLFPKVKFRGETPTREKLIKVINQAYKNNILFINKLPVIPPEQRPAFKDVEGNWTMDTLNDVYLNVLRRAFQVRSAAGSGPLFDILNYGLQSAVSDHHKFIHTKVGKKHGVIRDQLLSKRVDFTGRAVITPGPDLKVNEMGIPLRIAVNLFEPFLIHQLLYTDRINKELLSKEIKAFNDLELSVDGVKRVINAIKTGDVIPKTLHDIFFEATEVAMIGRVILSKRDPALHAESVRAYKPVLVDGNTLRLCTLACACHNADFDGDTMAVYHPLTDEAQVEAKAKMLKAVSGTSSDSITFELSKEMIVGLYLITKDKKPTNSPIGITKGDLDKATDPYVAVKFKRKTTTMGKALFNSCLPLDYPFVDKLINKKIIGEIIADLVNKYSGDVAREAIFKMEQIGFKFATIIGPSITLGHLELPEKVYQLKKNLEGATTEESVALLKQMFTITKKHLENTGFYDLNESGATKGWKQPMQILIAKGIIADPEGNILPAISGSFADGLTPTQFFNAASGARKGIIDRVLNTSVTGYMSRKLAFVLNNLEAHSHLKDCGTKRTVSVKLTTDIIKRITGRFHIVRGKIQEFDPKSYKVGDIINLRSPIFCESPKLCLTCYGKLLQRHKTPYVGVLAAQVIGAQGTQMILRTFHLGGAITVKEKDILQDIVNNDPMAEVER